VMGELVEGEAVLLCEGEGAEGWVGEVVEE